MENSGVLERIWLGLKQVKDPEIPVSVVDMGMIVAVNYRPRDHTAEVRLTYTQMGCPAMDMIEDDIKERLLCEPDIDAVAIDVVWDPVWDRRLLSRRARETMRSLGIAV